MSCQYTSRLTSVIFVTSSCWRLFEIAANLTLVAWPEELEQVWGSLGVVASGVMAVELMILVEEAEGMDL